MTARKSGDDLELTLVKKYDALGAVVRKTLKRSFEQAETLTFLPSSVQQANITLLEPFDNGEWLHQQPYPLDYSQHHEINSD